MQLKEHIAMAFGTPVVAYHWQESEDLNKELKALVLKAETQTPGRVRSNVKGWHSETDFFNCDAGCVRVLKERVETLAIELTRLIAAPTGQSRSFGFRSSAWANILRNGGYHSVHNHPNSMWSGVYNVDRGEPDATPNENGKLELLDPRGGINMVYIEKNVLDGRYVIEPVPGLMLVFPSWLKHMVHPYFGKGERISIAFNVSVEEKPGEAASK